MTGRSYSDPVVFSRDNQCGNKLAYGSRREAKAAMAHAQRKWGTRGLVCYLCPHCQHWHIGNDRFRRW